MLPPFLWDQRSETVWIIPDTLETSTESDQFLVAALYATKLTPRSSELVLIDHIPLPPPGTLNQPDQPDQSGELETDPGPGKRARDSKPTEGLAEHLTEHFAIAIPTRGHVEFEIRILDIASTTPFTPIQIHAFTPTTPTSPAPLVEVALVPRPDIDSNAPFGPAISLCMARLHPASRPPGYPANTEIFEVPSQQASSAWNSARRIVPTPPTPIIVQASSASPDATPHTTVPAIVASFEASPEADQRAETALCLLHIANPTDLEHGQTHIHPAASAQLITPPGQPPQNNDIRTLLWPLPDHTEGDLAVLVSHAECFTLRARVGRTGYTASERNANALTNVYQFIGDEFRLITQANLSNPVALQTLTHSIDMIYTSLEMTTSDTLKARNPEPRRTPTQFQPMATCLAATFSQEIPTETKLLNELTTQPHDSHLPLWRLAADAPDIAQEFIAASVIPSLADVTDPDAIQSALDTIARYPSETRDRFQLFAQMNGDFDHAANMKSLAQLLDEPAPDAPEPASCTITASLSALADNLEEFDRHYDHLFEAEILPLVEQIIAPIPIDTLFASLISAPATHHAHTTIQHLDDLKTSYPDHSQIISALQEAIQQLPRKPDIPFRHFAHHISETLPSALTTIDEFNASLFSNEGHPDAGFAATPTSTENGAAQGPSPDDASPDNASHQGASNQDTLRPGASAKDRLVQSREAELHHQVTRKYEEIMKHIDETSHYAALFQKHYAQLLSQLPMRALDDLVKNRTIKTTQLLNSLTQIDRTTIPAHQRNEIAFETRRMIDLEHSLPASLDELIDIQAILSNHLSKFEPGH